MHESNESAAPAHTGFRAVGRLVRIAGALVIVLVGLTACGSTSIPRLGQNVAAANLPLGPGSSSLRAWNGEPSGTARAESAIGHVPEATLFVAPDGRDSNDGRSPSEPLRSLERAAELVRPGDVVYLRGGTYPIQVFIRRSGTREEPIVWTSYPGEWAILDGSESPEGSGHRLWVEKADYNMFLNLEVRNSPQQGILVLESNNNLFRNIVTHGNAGSGIQNIRSSFNRYESITSYDNYDEDSEGEDADGIGLSSGDGNVIVGSIAYDNSDDGFDTWNATNSLIDTSVSHHNGRGDEGDGNGFKAGSAAGDARTVVQRSIAYENRASGFDYNSGEDVTFLNNTAYDNGEHGFVGGSTTVLRNNISAGNGNGNSVDRAEMQSNTWNLDISDPRFASTNPLDTDFLSLSAESPAIESGMDVGLPYDGDAPDLGAIEYRSTLAQLIVQGEALHLPLQEYAMCRTRQG